MIADCEICGSVVDQSKVGKTVNSNGKHWHGKCYETQVLMDQHKACWDNCVSRLKVSATEIARLTASLSTARNDALDEAVKVCNRGDIINANSAALHITALKTTPPAGADT
tara:strand:- start:20 stop:352 length:333 start_codon:yes stop_codon:yes gene_type:complete